MRTTDSDSRSTIHAFTLIELLMVITVIGILAGLVVGLAPLATQKSKINRVQAELAELVTAIERYKDELGFYPPDSRAAANEPLNAAVNGLFYELIGTVQEGDFFSPLNGHAPVSVSTIKQYFNAEGFANASTDRSRVKSFLVGLSESQRGEISDDPDVDVLLSPVEWNSKWNRYGLAPPVSEQPTLNPWRYDASSPDRHNRNSFDLWTVIVLGNEVRVIGNWKE